MTGSNLKWDIRQYCKVASLILVMLGLSGCRFGWLPLQAEPDELSDTAQVSSAEYYYRLGLKHTQSGSDQNFSKARQAFLKAAKRGHEEAQYLLALSFFNGKGGVSSTEKGLHWLEQAGINGQSDAQFRLGSIYLNGRNVSTEEVWGVHWLARAADQGHAKAQYQLGVVYATGLGWQQDLAEAWRWLMLAKKRDVAEAETILKKLWPRLTAQELDEGELLLSKWRKVDAESGLPRAQIRFIQQALNRLGFSSGSADGFSGPVTRKAIGTFRSRYNVSGSGGRINTALITALRKALKTDV